MKQYLPKLKALVNTSAHWEGFLQMLDANIEAHQRKLEQASDVHEMFKAQGAIAALRHLKYLKDEVNAASREKVE